MPARFADDDIDVVARIDLSQNETGGFVLAAALAVTIAGIDQQAAERLVQGADAICPYSNAIRGNVDVAVSVSTREPDRSISSQSRAGTRSAEVHRLGKS